MMLVDSLPASLPDRVSLAVSSDSASAWWRDPGALPGRAPPSDIRRAAAGPPCRPAALAAWHRPAPGRAAGHRLCRVPAWGFDAPEKPLLHRARIQFFGQRTGRPRPGDVRSVHARITDVIINAGGLRRGPEFERRKRSPIARRFGRHLVHGNAVAIDVDAERLGDRGAGQEARRFHVVPVAALGRRVPQVVCRW